MKPRQLWCIKGCGRPSLMPHSEYCRSCATTTQPAAQPAPDAVPIGAYVLATKYADADPGDPWAVGWYEGERDGRHYVKDGSGKTIRANGYRRVGLISTEVGEWLLKIAAAALEASPPGTVNLWTMLNDQSGEVRQAPQEDRAGSGLMGAVTPPAPAEPPDDLVAAQINDWLNSWPCAKPPRIVALTQERDTLTDYLLRHGFVRCDIPACNCGSWHHRYGLPERWDELKDDIAEAGHPLCNDNGNNLRNALRQLVTERDKLREVVAAAEEMLKMLVDQGRNGCGCLTCIAYYRKPFDAALAKLERT